MKNCKRIATVVLSILMIITSFVFTASSDSTTVDVGEGYISFNLNDIRVEIDPKVATVEYGVNFEGENAIKITPSPATAGDIGRMTLNTYSLNKYASSGETVNVPQYKYVGVKYYYASENPTFTGKPEFYFLPGATNAVSEVLVTANNDIVTNQWAEAYFDFSKMTVRETDKPYLNQVYFWPFGRDIKPADLSKRDVLYISEYTFYEKNPDKTVGYTVSYFKGHASASGIETTEQYTIGDKFVLPECSFVLATKAFIGWQSSTDGKIYQPGSEIIVEDNMSFTAQWGAMRSPDGSRIEFDYLDYGVEIPNGADTGFLERVVKDGKTAMKMTANPNTTKDIPLYVSGFNYNQAAVDVKEYPWFAIEYYYESPNPRNDFTIRMDILPTGGAFVGNDWMSVTPEETVEAGRWGMLVYNFGPTFEGKLNPDVTTHYFKQIYIMPFQTNLAKDVPSEDAIYISKMYFFKEEPEFLTHDGYMNGYTDGTFKPEGTMTRAEACAVVARQLEAEANITGVSGFTDVPSNLWYAKYIGYCKQRGLLGSYPAGAFYPDKPITRAEFSELVYLTGLAKDQGIIASFTDVSPSHPKYNSIMAAASAGLINGYLKGEGTYEFRPDATISRAEVATIINRALEIDKTQSNLSTGIYYLFLDVDSSHWAFADIAEATVPHVEFDGSWAYATTNPILSLQQKLGGDSVFDIAAGNAKVAELDELEAQRVAEIRNTPNMDPSNFVAKKTVYVSSSTGDDANDGSSPEKPVKTLAKANLLIPSGGAVLLKRGDMWRERIQTKGGTIYSAYGEGPKPVLNGSPEDAADPSKWILHYEDPTTGALIWKFYREDIRDIGSIVFNGGEGFAYKEFPSFRNGMFMTYDFTREFDYKVELDRNFEFFHKADSMLNSSGVIDISQSTGPIYLRCDNGNPGKLFESIEFIGADPIIKAKETPTVIIDNLCLLYGYFGVSTSNTFNVTVQNCEIGFIGGNLGGYESGRPTRLGNGIEAWGVTDGFYVRNNYIYQVYDAGATHQSSPGGTMNIRINNVEYSNNVITDCTYAIEYFLRKTTNPNFVSNGQNHLIEGNLLRRSGFGFGSMRPDTGNEKIIRSNGANEFSNFIIRNNIFDRAAALLLETMTEETKYEADYEGNVYIQGLTNKFISHGPDKAADMDISAEYAVKGLLGDASGEVYYVEYIPPYKFDFTIDNVVPVTAEERQGLAGN